MIKAFGRASWLTDRFNGYRQRDVLTAGWLAAVPTVQCTASVLNSVPGSLATNMFTILLKRSRCCFRQLCPAVN